MLGIIRSLMKKVRKKMKKTKKLKLKSKEEVYVKFSPAQFAKYIPKAYRHELADLKKEILEKNKQMEELTKQIDLLRRRLGETTKAEIEEAKKFLKKIKKSNEFKILFKTEKPIMVVSNFSDNLSPFRDKYGEEYPYLAGIVISNSPYGPTFSIILSKQPNNYKDIKVLETTPQITLFNLTDVLPKEIPMVFNYIKRGLLPINVTPDGYLVPHQLKSYVYTSTLKEVVGEDVGGVNDGKKRMGKRHRRDARKDN